ncbi:MAG: MFS transporter [Proteobacteria bacterium]|nr:MFS transporter [Pseudomonadota bacterium]MBU4131943.1 MFS transporter [Pseudomonadota bacterium]
MKLINKEFTLLLSGQLVSQVGDKFHMIALSFWVLQTTGSSAKMGLVLAASLVPSLVVGFFSGTFIDRHSRKTIIVGTDLLRGLVLFIFAVLFIAGKMDFYLILTLQVILSVNAAFFDPAIPSIIPQIVDENQLARANGLHQFVSGFSLVGGAMLGGIVVSGAGYVWVFFLNGLSFIVSALFESFIRIPPLPVEKKNSYAVDMKGGYRYLFDNQHLMVLLFMVMVIHLFVGSIEVFMPVIADRISEDGPRTLGFFQAAFGCGTLVMAILLGMGRGVGNEKFALFASVFFIGAVFGASFFIQGSIPTMTGGFLFCLFFMGCALALAGVCFRTLLQRGMDNRFSGRIFALAGSLGNASIPGAMIFYGLLLDRFDFHGLLLLTGLLLMLTSLVSFILYKEKRR